MLGSDYGVTQSFENTLRMGIGVFVKPAISRFTHPAIEFTD